MNCKPLMSGDALIEITQQRYEQLVKNEAKLHLLEKAIAKSSSYDMGTLRSMFGIERIEE